MLPFHNRRGFYNCAGLKAKSFAVFLCNVKTASPLARKALIKHATTDNIKALTEIASNFLKGNLKVSGPLLKKLKLYIKVM